jgi:hypothetical protein
MEGWLSKATVVEFTRLLRVNETISEMDQRRGKGVKQYSLQIGPMQRYAEFPTEAVELSLSVVHCEPANEFGLSHLQHQEPCPAISRC